MDFGYTPATDPANGKGPKLSTFLILIAMGAAMLGIAWLVFVK